MWPLKDWVAVIYTPFIYTLPPAESIKRETGVQGNKYVCTATVGPVCIYKNNSPAQCFSHCFSFHFRAVAQPIKILCHRLLKESRGRTLLWGPSLEVYIFFLMKEQRKGPFLYILDFCSLLCLQGETQWKLLAILLLPGWLSHENRDFILTRDPITRSP